MRRFRSHPRRSYNMMRSYSVRDKMYRHGQRVRAKRAAAIAASRRSNRRTGGFTGIEKKFFDTTYNIATIPASWVGSEAETATFGLFCPTQGDGASGRDGRQVVIKSIHMKGAITTEVDSDQADVKAPVKVTLLVILDTQTNGAQAQGETIMDASPAGTEEWCSFRNLEYGRRFKTLFRKVVTLNTTVAGTDGANTLSIAGNARYFNFNKYVNIPVEFTASTGAITDISTNSIHVYCIASNSDIASLQYCSRVRFVG